MSGSPRYRTPCSSEGPCSSSTGLGRGMARAIGACCVPGRRAAGRPMSVRDNRSCREWAARRRAFPAAPRAPEDLRDRATIPEMPEVSCPLRSRLDNPGSRRVTGVGALGAAERMLLSRVGRLTAGDGPTRVVVVRRGRSAGHGQWPHARSGGRMGRSCERPGALRRWRSRAEERVVDGAAPTEHPVGLGALAPAEAT